MELNNNRHNIFSSNIAPNPTSVKYWADLATDPSGAAIKTFKDGKWTTITSDAQQDKELDDIKKGMSLLETAVNNKQDKVSGKGLSTNDYTTEDKNKVASLSNYNDTELRELITALTLKVDSLEERIAALETPAA